MKISSEWLKTHLDHKLSVEELSARLHALGFEVAGVERRGPQFTGVVVAKVASREKHPNADRLSVCVVDDGASRWNVVCGAPNVAAGQTVAFARVGAVLPGGHTIGAAKLRGVESQGMICSRGELGLPKTEDGIWVLGEGASLGANVGDLIGGRDEILEVEVTSNRPDCLSHRGLARELAAAGAGRLKPSAATLTESFPTIPSVEVEDAAACPFYGGRIVEGITVGESPAWLKARLESIGLRPVNNVVDVTNFILHDCGQPLHAFDLDRLDGERLLVRRSRAGERLLALDHKTYDLPAGLLVIADGARPVALAGVMGGEETSVTAKTTRIVLEGALFAPAEARRSSQKTRLRSDSSYRFERGVDPALPPTAARAAAALIVELCGGRAGPAAEKIAPARPAPAVIKTSVARINQILGAEFGEVDVVRALGAHAGTLSDVDGKIEFTAPTWRADLTTAWDLAEEVGRLLGYDRIPSRLASLTTMSATVTPLELELRRTRRRLSAAGLCEAYNYDLLSEKSLAACRLSAAGLPRIANPLSEDWAVLRPSLLPGLLRSVRHNLSRGADSVRLFEVGKIYGATPAAVSERWTAGGVLVGPVGDVRWQAGRAPRASFHDGKAAAEAVLAGQTISWRPLNDAASGRCALDELLHPADSLRAIVDGKPVATVGLLHPRAARALDLENEGAVVFEVDIEALGARPRPAVQAREISPFPAARRDIAVVLDRGAAYADVVAAAESCGLAELQDILLFDVYEGAGIPAEKKSLALRLTFGRPDRTLTDAEIAGYVDKIVAALSARVGAVLRS